MTSNVVYAVLVSGVAYMVLGALWYSPVLFGKSWMKLIGKSEEQVKKDFKPINYLWAFIGSLIAAYGIARIMVSFGGSTIRDGMIIGLVAGICFVGAAFFINDLFESRPKGLTFINVLYHLTGFIVMGIIIGAWQ